MSVAHPWPGPVVIAHRGAGTLAPENTLAAMRAGHALGARGVEFDVMLAADAVPVLMHDPDFGRTIAGSGSVSATPAAQLQARDAGAWFGPAFAGEPVPLYTEVLDFCRTHGVWMNVEIKPAPGTEALTGTVVARTTAAARLPAGLVLFSSFSRVALEAARKVAPEIPRGMLFGRIPADWREVLFDLDAVALHCAHATLDADTARAVKAAGYGLMCYTVNTVERALALRAWGVDGLCTDRPDLLLTALNAPRTRVR